MTKSEYISAARGEVLSIEMSMKQCAKYLPFNLRV
jgi:hypothetical protein